MFCIVCKSPQVQYAVASIIFFSFFFFLFFYFLFFFLFASICKGEAPLLNINKVKDKFVWKVLEDQYSEC